MWVVWGANPQVELNGILLQALLLQRLCRFLPAPNMATLSVLTPCACTLGYHRTCSLGYTAMTGQMFRVQAKISLRRPGDM